MLWDKLYVEYHAHMSERFLINIKYGNPKHVFPNFLLSKMPNGFLLITLPICVPNNIGGLAPLLTQPSIYCCHHGDIHVQYIKINMLSVGFLRFGVILYLLVLPKPFRVASPALSQRWSEYLLSNAGSLFATKTRFYWYMDSHYKHVTTVSRL